MKDFLNALKVKAGYDGKPQQWKFGFDLACRELVKAKAVQQWISVKNEMPEQGQKVLVFRPHAHEKPYKDPNYKICTYAGEDIFINSHFEHEITHWMPLPKPPTKECK
ncbi:DUF551 domain-containing protein [Acinetobacter sp. YH12211]|uniref:DUF551 domain-containing protein n=1 Tax=Acinetobacter sp. YH12211 TaxID=2601147 RepID=UPI0015D3D3A8|nr:DUF551 domain-containing protein [Acinetobacter sp. YH12211]